MPGGPVGALPPLLEAKLPVSGRADVDTTRRRRGPCYVTRYGNVRDVVTTSTSRSTHCTGAEHPCVSCNGWVYHEAIKVSPRPDIDAGRVVRLYMTLWGAVMSMGSYQNG